MKSEDIIMSNINVDSLVLCQNRDGTVKFSIHRSSHLVVRIRISFGHTYVHVPICSPQEILLCFFYQHCHEYMYIFVLYMYMSMMQEHFYTQNSICLSAKFYGSKMLLRLPSLLSPPPPRLSDLHRHMNLQSRLGPVPVATAQDDHLGAWHTTAAGKGGKKGDILKLVRLKLLL